MRTADFHAEKSSDNDPPREDLPAQSTGDDQHRSLPSTDIKLQFVRTVLPAFFFRFHTSTDFGSSNQKTGYIYSQRRFVFPPPFTDGHTSKNSCRSKNHPSAICSIFFSQRCSDSSGIFFQYIPHRKVTYFDNIAQTADQLCPPFQDTVSHYFSIRSFHLKTDQSGQ